MAYNITAGMNTGNTVNDLSSYRKLTPEDSEALKYFNIDPSNIGSQINGDWYTSGVNTNNVNKQLNDYQTKFSPQAKMWGQYGTGWKDPANIGKTSAELNALGANTSIGPGGENWTYQGNGYFGPATSPTSVAPSTNLTNTAQPVGSPNPINVADPTNSFTNVPSPTSVSPNTGTAIANPIMNNTSTTPTPPNIQSNLPSSTPVSTNPYAGPTESLVNNMTSPANQSYSTMSQAPSIGGNPTNTNKKLNTFGAVQ